MAADFVLNSGNAGSKHPLLLRRLAWTCSCCGRTSSRSAGFGASAVPSLGWLDTLSPQGACTVRRARPRGKALLPAADLTFTQLARTTGTISAGTVTRIAPGPAAGGSAVLTVAINFHVEQPPTRYRSGGEFYDSGVAGPVGQAGSVTQWGNTCFSFSASPELYPPSKLGLSSAAGERWDSSNSTRGGSNPCPPNSNLLLSRQIRSAQDDHASLSTILS
jgi:hypothetical protein